MPDFIFLDKAKQPDEEMLMNVLGKAYGIWGNIKQQVNDAYGPITEEWKYYSKNSGWTMKLMLKKRNLLFFTPYKQCFGISFVFGDKAVAKVNESNLPQSIKDELNNAEKYAEGRGLRLEIKTKKEAESILELINIKVNN